MTTLPRHLAELQAEIETYAKDYGLDIFTTIYELVDYRQMCEIAAYEGFPVRYPHWRFGMEFDRMMKSQTYGLSKIYELVINTDPCYAYLLEGNSMVDQKLVMCHVSGHCDFFKHNRFFSHTDRRMIDGMANHATRVRRHMDRQGIDKVEQLLLNKKIPEATAYCKQNSVPMTRILLAGIINYEKSEAELKEILEEAGRQEVPLIRSHLAALGTIASVAPLLGLLGTVVGMIDVFATLSEQTEVNPTMLAGGISTALVTTAFGMVIAMPTLASYNYFIAKVQTLIIEMEKISLHMVAVLKRV